MGNDQGGPARKRGVERPLHRQFRLGVQVRRRLVEDEQPGAFEEEPGDGEALLFPTGEPVAAVAHDGVESLRQRLDEVLDLRATQRLPHVRFAGGRARESEVGPDGVVEEVRLLSDNPDGGAHRGQRCLPQVHPLEANAPTARVIEARNEIGDRRLAGAAGPDERDQLPRPRREGDVPKHGIPASPIPLNGGLQ